MEENTPPEGLRLAKTNPPPQRQYNIPGLRRITGTPAPEGTICAHHQSVNAVRLCSRCRKAICEVCSFEFPNFKVFCPECASRPLDPFPGDRRSKLIGAYVLALVGSIAVGLLFSGMLEDTIQNDLVFGIVLMLFFFLPCLIGFSLAFGALDKRRGNTVAVWLALAWNILGLVGFTCIQLLGIYVILNGQY